MVSGQMNIAANGGGAARGQWTEGSLANQGSHLIDLILWFMGDPVRVYGETAVLNHDIETEDVGMALLTFPGEQENHRARPLSLKTLFQREVRKKGGILLILPSMVKCAFLSVKIGLPRWIIPSTMLLKIWSRH